MINLKADFSKQLSCEYSIFASFQYNSYYVDIIKGLSNRVYNSTDKTWEIDYINCYTPLIEILNKEHIPYNATEFLNSIELLKQKVEEKQAIKATEQKIDASIIDNTEFKLTPREYQKQGIAFGLEQDKFLLADEQGLGKSLQCLNIARLKKGGQHCLIIVGYDTLQFNWANEVEKCTKETAFVLGQRLLSKGKNKGKLRLKGLKERIEDLKNLKNNENFFIITSVTTLRTNEKIKYTNKQGKDKTYHNFIVADIIEQLCQEGVIGRVIFDEGQVVKDYNALQTQALLRIKSCPYKIIATGTPIMNEHIDLFPLLSWLQKEDMNYYQFKNTYCILDKYNTPIGNKNGDVLHNKLKNIMLRRLKKDVVDLPEKIIINEYLEMNDKQFVLYEKLVKLFKMELAKTKDIMVIRNMFINLRKITCNTRWYDSNIDESVKFDRVKQLMNEIAENDQKCIIFSNWSTPINWLYDELCMYNPAMITGDTKDRMEQINKFQTQDSCRLIVGTGGAMGTGITLTAASNEIFIDEPWNKALKDQWEDRAHRIGTKNNINIYTLICKNTIDELVHKRVEEKGKICKNVIDGVSLEELQNYFKNF